MIIVGVDESTAPPIYIRNTNMTGPDRFIHLRPDQARLLCTALMKAVGYLEKAEFDEIEVEAGY